jgi:hypothetical protein
MSGLSRPAEAGQPLHCAASETTLLQKRRCFRTDAASETALPQKRRAVLLDRRALEPTALALRQAAPDAEPLVVLQCVLQALGANIAAAADALGFPGGPALLGEERLRIRLRAQRLVLPALIIDILLMDANVR